jgi:hypothetical protein
MPRILIRRGAGPALDSARFSAMLDIIAEILVAEPFPAEFVGGVK